MGPAITFLFVGPAINILALTYTGVAIGTDIAVARLALALRRFGAHTVAPESSSSPVR